MEIILKNVRLAFPNLFDAEEFMGSTTYNCKLFIEEGSEQHKLVMDAIKKEIALRWPKRADFMYQELRMDKKAFCYIDGKRVDYSGAEGNWVLTAKRNVKDGRPLVIDRDKSPIQKTDGKVYSGCYVNAKVEIYTTDGDSKGVRCGLSAIQFVKDGDSFGGAKAATDTGFDDLGVDEAAEADIF